MRSVHSRLRLAGWLMMMVLAVLLSACGGGEEIAEDQAGDETSETDDAATADDATDGDGEAEGDDAAARGAVTLALAQGGPGEHLVDGDGNTLYLFTNDEQGQSACTGGCADTWPPLTADGDVTVSDGLDSGLVGTVARDDGTQQVTYNDWPLYYFANDDAPGDANGQGQGGVWFVVDAAGEPIEG